MNSRRAPRRRLGPTVAAFAALGLAACESQQAWFPPGDDGEAVIVDEIGAASRSVHVAIYTFTSEPIRDALVHAAQRGVEVRVLADPQPGINDAVLASLERAGIPVRFASNEAGGIMHNKFTVVDGRTVLTGSFNYTVSANTLNDENVLRLVSERLAGQFEAAFEELWDREQ